MGGSGRPPSPPAIAVALAVVAAAALVLPGLGGAPFDDPGEGMHAQIARELAASGDPFALTLGGVRYVDKPPLLYALLAAAFALAGPGEAAARTVPALAALAAVAGTAWLGARLLGPRGGVLAGLALLTSPGFFAFARYVRPESLFVAALAWGFALCLTGLADGRRARVAAGLAAFGLAALAKDPLGALAPPLALGAAIALGGGARPLRRWLPWPGVVACAVLGFGWWLLAERRTPGYLWYTLVDNHVLNVLGARAFPDEDVTLDATTFLLVALVGAGPWALAAGVALVSLVRRRAWRDPAEVPWVALALWALGVLAATLVSRFRLPHYGLPAYFAFALLAARAWGTPAARGLAWAHALLLAAVAAACALAWAGGGAGVLGEVLGATDVATRKSALAGAAAPVPPWEALRPLVGATALALGLGAVAVAASAAVPGLARRGAAGFVVIAALVGVLPSVGAALALVSGHRAAASIGHAIAAHAGPHDVLVHEGPLENSGALEWYARRRPVIVDGRVSVLAFGAGRAEARATFWDEARLRQAWAAGRVWLVSVRPPERSVAVGLPGARLVASAGGRWLWVNGAR